MILKVLPFTGCASSSSLFQTRVFNKIPRSIKYLLIFLTYAQVLDLAKSHTFQEICYWKSWEGRFISRLHGLQKWWRKSNYDHQEDRRRY